MTARKGRALIPRVQVQSRITQSRLRQHSPRVAAAPRSRRVGRRDHPGPGAGSPNGVANSVDLWLTKTPYALRRLRLHTFLDSLDSRRPSSSHCSTRFGSWSGHGFLCTWGANTGLLLTFVCQSCRHQWTVEHQAPAPFLVPANKRRQACVGSPLPHRLRFTAFRRFTFTESP